MQTQITRLGPETDDESAIREAAACLAEGGLVVFPTETVYGVGANAADPAAVARLREIKQRLDGKPFTVHVGSRSAVDRFVPGLKGVGRRLTEKAWPGPLTIIFPVEDVSAAPVIRETSLEHAPAMYHEGTIGIRCPDDSYALELLQRAGVPVVAASANPAGAGAPVDADEAAAALGGQVYLVLDAGRARYGRASTIVRVDADGYEVVREGVYDARTLRRLTSVNFLLVCSGNTCRSPMAAGILRRLLAERLGCSEKDLEDKGYHVESAGTSAYAGARVSEPAVRIMSGRGIDVADHRARSVAVEQLHRADHVLVMTRGHAETLRAMAPSAAERVRMLAEGDIEDPVGQPDEAYARCAAQIEKALRKRLEEVTL